MSYAPVTYTAIAAQTDFIITFDFLRDSHVIVTVDDVIQAVTTDYTIESNHTVVRLVTPLAGGEEVILRRVTPVDTRLVDFVAGAGLSEVDLDESFNQVFFALEEFNDLTDIDTITAALAAIAASVSAAAASASAASSSASAASSSASAASTSASSAAASLAAFGGLTAGFIAGCGLSWVSTTTFTVGIGRTVSQDSAHASIVNTAAKTVDVTASGVLGLGVARATSTWYHVFLIKKDSDSTISAYADTSASAANIPAGYTSYRRVGSIYLNTTGSGEVEPFEQFGDEFWWTTPVLQLNNDAYTADTAETVTLLVPPDRNVQAIFNVVGDSSNAGAIYGSPLAITDGDADLTVAPLGQAFSGSGSFAGAQMRVWTNTSKQVRLVSSINQNIYLTTVGWRDLRDSNIQV